MKRRRVALKSTLVVTPGYGDEDAPVGIYMHDKRSMQLIYERDKALKKRQEHIMKLPNESRNAVNDMLVDNGAVPDDGASGSTPFDPLDSTYEASGESDLALPEFSNAGGELYDAVSQFSQQHKSKKLRYDIRTQLARNKRINQSWMIQISMLADAFLSYKHRSVVQPEDPISLDDSKSRAFEVMTIDVFARTKENFRQAPGEPANACLLRSGYLGCSPTFPTVAINIDTLELYHRLRRRNPQISIQCITKTLCDLHGVNYMPVFRKQVSEAFDAYLAILREVQKRVDRVMGQDTPNWRVQNCCPCCNYRLEDEPLLSPARLLAMDGNNSAKRVLSAGTEDPRIFKSDYFLSRQDVDRFQYEVKRRQEAVSHHGEDGSDNDESDDPRPPDDVNKEHVEGDAADGAIKKTTCTDRWKASSAEHEKRALAVYDTTGIFAVSCRHGFILKVCEMVRSGELAKYPLAIVDHLLDTLGEDQAIGYDIGCAFSQTMRNSTMVGPKAELKHVTVTPNAFHGWLHNRLCQVTTHPLYRSGFGIEDLEGMERIFSSTNGVARCTRNSTPFHWTQFFDLHFHQWDEDKYEELGNFLYNNYRQALDILAEYRPEVTKMKRLLNVTDADIDSWLQDETSFLQDLKDAPPQRAVQSAYAEAICKTQKLYEEWDKMQLMNNSIVVESSTVGSYDSQVMLTQQRESARRRKMEKYHTSLRNLEVLENNMAALGFSDIPWTETHSQFRDALEYSHTQKFHRSLDKLQQLVIQRLFELQKAHMTGVGYKMRMHIWKALRARSKAIQVALNKYNSLAVLMRPPAPTLEWKDIVNYSFVAEFDLLKHRYSHFDITSLPWASSANREVANKYHKIKRAEEEIIRLNVEIHRLCTFIRDEEVQWNSCAKDLSLTDPVLSAEILSTYQRRSRVNMRLLQRIDDIKLLKGYSGTSSRGTQKKPTQFESTQVVDNRLNPQTLIGRGSDSCRDRSDGSMDDGERENERVDDCGHEESLSDDDNNDVDDLNEMMVRWNDFLESSSL